MGFTFRRVKATVTLVRTNPQTVAEQSRFFLLVRTYSNYRDPLPILRAIENYFKIFCEMAGKNRG
jgi:hypothetical protein